MMLFPTLSTSPPSETTLLGTILLSFVGGLRFRDASSSLVSWASRVPTKVKNPRV